ncbi:hypothetical protein ATJ88_3240 [Isoptericola jiangsuensis]|uniref:Uncharacterized protein n=1 Tax=Isoptericola jiangsuensis TaxID=548579 RepID=A0A2A9F234_9MICO|nr:hypothetical protein [Isoptericola jiangsuensis]PFG44515.1 hypothetical protein ATJ88_3240 [Isoptericola jiangsuensis]
MARLSSIVGGLLRDLAESHSVADAFTVQTLETYRHDPVLSQLPVPRMAIGEVQLTLRFVVDAVEDPTGTVDPQQLLDVWRAAVRDRVLPRALASAGRLDNPRIVAALDKRLARPGVAQEVDLASALDPSRTGTLDDLTVKFVEEQVAALAPTFRKSLDGSSFSEDLKAVVAEEAGGIEREVEAFRQAQVAPQSDVDVRIDAAALAATPESQVSELRLTVRPEELSLGASATTGLKAV